MATLPAKRKRAPKDKENKLDILDPRQSLFLSIYMDPKSPTFSNALQSALRAGYSQEYAENITAQMPVWLSENLGKEKRVHLAEAHLDEILEMPTRIQAMGAFGPIFEKRETFVIKKLKNGKTKKVKRVEKVPVLAYSTSLIKEKTKVTELILEAHKPETYGKKKGPNISFSFNIKETKDRYT